MDAELQLCSAHPDPQDGLKNPKSLSHRRGGAACSAQGCSLWCRADSSSARHSSGGCQGWIRWSPWLSRECEGPWLGSPKGAAGRPCTETLLAMEEGAWGAHRTPVIPDGDHSQAGNGIEPFCRMSPQQRQEPFLGPASTSHESTAPDTPPSPSSWCLCSPPPPHSPSLAPPGIQVIQSRNCRSSQAPASSGRQ